MNSLQYRQIVKTLGDVLSFSLRVSLMALFAFSFVGGANKASAQEEKLKNTQKAQIKVDKDAKDSQDRVSKTAEKTRTIVDEYRATLRKIENAKIYNEQLRKLIDSQEKEMTSIAKQIDDLQNTNKEIFPLMLRMIANLEKFVELDVPFLPEERGRRVANLKKLMDKAKVSTSEKFRNILEAYQIENEYGRTIEAYRGLQTVDGKELTVDFLRVGRISLVYQTLDGKEQGFWDQKERKWKELSSSYRKDILQGLKMARKQAAPELLTMPVPAPEEAQVETL